MEKLNYVVVSATNNIGGSFVDTDMYFPFTGNKNGNPPKSFAKTKKEIWGYITEDQFKEKEDLEYLGFDGDYYVYADGKGKRFFSKIGKGIASAAKWVGTGVKNLVTKWGANIRKRKELRKSRKSERQQKEYAKALQEAKKKGMSEEVAKKAASTAESKVRQEQESLIAAAEVAAFTKAKSENKSVEDQERLADEAGQNKEKEIFGGYLADENKGFWKSMGTGGKIAIVGGGALFIGLVVYLLVKKK